MGKPKLSDLIDLSAPDAVLAECRRCLEDFDPPLETAPVTRSFADTVALYEGSFPGYRKCSTGYYDLRHALGTFLTSVRLLHGASRCGRRFDPVQLTVNLTAALLHDAGYIRRRGDDGETGTRYRLDHVQRSADFLDIYLEKRGFGPQARADGRAMVLCTDISVKVAPHEFSGESASFLGRLLRAADLMAQLSDRTYLEKLLFLYHEFKEAGIGDFDSELDLLKKIAVFYETICRRLEPVAALTDEYLRQHFQRRYAIDANFYRQSIERQRRYLLKILSDADADVVRYLKRDGIVERIRTQYGIADNPP